MTNWTEVLDRLVAHAPEAERGDPPFATSLAIPYPDKWEPGSVTATWPVDKRFLNERHVIFGGYLAALSDSMMGMVTMSVLEADELFATSDLRTSFLRPVKQGSLTIAASVLHRSRNLVYTEVTLADDKGQLVAKASATQIVLRA